MRCCPISTSSDLFIVSGLIGPIAATRSCSHDNFPWVETTVHETISRTVFVRGCEKPSKDICREAGHDSGMCPNLWFPSTFRRDWERLQQGSVCKCWDHWELLPCNTGGAAESCSFASVSSQDFHICRDRYYVGLERMRKGCPGPTLTLESKSCDKLGT